MTQQDDAEIINTRFAPEWCVGHRKQTGTQHHQSVDSNLHMFMEKPSRHLAAEQNNGPLCHNDKTNSQPHFEEMVLSSQPILLRNGAWMTVERMKTPTNM